MHIFQREFLKTSSSSDKIGEHGYQRFYPWFLAHFKHQKINLLEVGLSNYDSVHLWKEYFDNAEIYGVDIEPKNLVDIKSFTVDQSDRNQLREFADSINVKFDLIIDDGSHVPKHQLDTLEIFWKLLKPGGIYVLEDIETSYWGNSECYGYRFNANQEENNVIHQFKYVIDSINKEYSGGQSAKSKFVLSQVVSGDIEMVSFGSNCIIIIKKNPSFSKYYDRTYRYENRKNSFNWLKKFKKLFNN